ncbi:MAG: YicC family protein [Clostridiales Family XIII bacterium]|nr:YicC family protein [Clostridiales Family XIII bacterium]
MIKSMTGYGRGKAEADGWRAQVFVKTVNNRYTDMNVRMPRLYQFAEEAVKKAIREYVSRGKIDIQVEVESNTETTVYIKPDIAAAKGYYRSLRELEREFDVSPEISLEFLASQQDVLVSRTAEFDEAAAIAVCAEAARAAGGELDAMRLLEGAQLAEDMAMRAGIIGGYIDSIEERAPELPKIYAEKLAQRIAEISGIERDSEIFEQKIAVETAVMADKCNITEEIVRLRSHIAQLVEITAGASGKGGGKGDAVGKKLDFLMQEMNREANTIGSKANDLKITNLMLELKSEIEKIREQVQNIE